MNLEACPQKTLKLKHDKVGFSTEKGSPQCFTRYVGFSILKCIFYVPIMSDEVCTVIYNSVPFNCFLNLEVFDV